MCDFTLPSFDGDKAFKIKNKIAPETPFIFVSGKIGEEKSIEYIKKGVTDYVIKEKLFTLNTKVLRALKDSKQSREKYNANQAFHRVFNDLQKIMSSSLDIICSIDDEGRFVNVSSASERIIGFKPGELIGRKYMDLVAKEDAEKTIDTAQKIKNGEAVNMFENHYIHKNGSTVPILWSAAWDEKDKLMYCIAKDATEKKRLEKTFEKERTRFLDLFLQAPFCMGILNGVNHVFTMVNPLYLDLIGKKNIIGKPVRDVLPEIANQGFIKILDSVYNTGKTFSAKEMLIRLNKNNKNDLVDVYIDFIYQVYKNSEEIIEGIFFFAIDVTEQVLLRKKIEQSENRFRAIIEKSAEMIMLSTKDGKLLYAAPSITKVLGYFLNEIPASFVTMLVHPLDLPQFTENTGKIIESPGKFFNSELRLLHKNGSWIWCDATITNMLEEIGVHAVVLNFRDISEKKGREQQREFDKINLNALINNTSDLMWSVDRDFNLITSNQPFDETIRMMSGNTIAKGESILSLGFSPEKHNTFKKAYERAFTGEAFSDVEYNAIPVESWSEISYYPILKGGKIIGTACHSHDITERKIAEIEKGRITNDLMRHNKDLAQFTYIISHNLRAPVANIMGFANALQSGKLKDEQEKPMMDHLMTSVKKLDEVIRDLNHLLQVKNSVTEKKEAVRFSDLILDIQSSMDNLVKSEHVKFIIDFNEVNEIQTVKSYLYSILFNLISNSIKYRIPGISPIIELTTKKIENKIELIFRDNGLGIDLQTRGREIFGLYKRFHSHTEGKGVGLFMVKAQVETLGGTISVSSKPNEGMEFRILFLSTQV